MTFTGTFSHRNLKGSEKIHEDTNHNNVDHRPRNHPPAQFITINGVDYFIRYADGNFCNDNRLNQFNNKTVNVEGTFAGHILMITSITKVGP